MKFAIVLLLVGIVTVSCLPKRGRGGGGRGRGRKAPCEGWDNVETCECTDGNTYDTEAAIKENCGKGSENPIVSCVCADGEEWTKPAKGGRGRKRGNKDSSEESEESAESEESTEEETTEPIF